MYYVEILIPKSNEDMRIVESIEDVAKILEEWKDSKAEIRVKEVDTSTEVK